MACLDMYSKDPNPNNGGVATHFVAPMSPRISFSNDFVESAQPPSKPVLELAKVSDASPSSDFEFTVTTYSMMSADQLFFKGQLLPFKDACRHGNRGAAAATTTLREEILAAEEEHDHEHDMALRPSTSTGWKGMLGLRKAHVGSKKVEAKVKVSTPGTAYRIPASQEVVDEGRLGCGDIGMGM